MDKFKRKYNESRLAIQNWVNKNEQNSKNEEYPYYPEIFNKLVEILEVTPSKNPNLPPISEFERGCARFEDAYLQEELVVLKTKLKSHQEKYNAAKEVLQDWVDKQGQERCWYYPDKFTELAEILDVPITKVPPPSVPQLRRLCRRYQDEQYPA